MTPVFETPTDVPLKPKYDVSLANFSMNFNLRRYNQDEPATGALPAVTMTGNKLSVNGTG
jgi:hypothetical protein